MSEIKDGGPAFPHPQGWRPDGEMGEGLSLRDYFAAKVMPAVWADKRPLNDYDCALFAYRIADAMLRARRA